MALIFASDIERAAVLKRQAEVSTPSPDPKECDDEGDELSQAAGLTKVISLNDFEKGMQSFAKANPHHDAGGKYTDPASGAHGEVQRKGKKLAQKHKSQRAATGAQT